VYNPTGSLAHPRVTRQTQMIMMFSNLSAFFGITVLSLSLVHALPIWHDFNTRSSIDSFVTGFSCLLAGGVRFSVPYYLTTPSPTGTGALVGRAHPLTISLTRGRSQAQLETSRYHSYLARRKPRYSLCVMANSFIIPMNRTSCMSTY